MVVIAGLASSKLVTRIVEQFKCKITDASAKNVIAMHTIAALESILSTAQVARTIREMRNSKKAEFLTN